MSFRNYCSPEQQNIKIEDHAPSQLFLSSQLPSSNSKSATDSEIVSKIADIVVNLHQTLLLKCRNIEIFRDLSQQEQNLLLQTDKTSSLHTVLAGTLAIDSCIKSLEKEQQFVVGNLLRANSALISNYKSLQREYSQNRVMHQTIQHLNDSIKFVTRQLLTLPSTKGLQHELEKHLAILELTQDTPQSQEWLKAQYTSLMSDLQKYNELLRIGVREKENYIKNLQSRLQRSSLKVDKNDEKKTVTSSKFRINTQKSSENDSTSQPEMQQLYEEICRLREQLQKKSKIIYKMNEEFASEMQKYNSVFRRLQEENRILKKYNDVETGYLLEELQAELEMLREQKRKDQLIIADIQSKIEAISYPRMNRINTQDKFNQHNPYERFNGNYPQTHNPQMQNPNQYPDRNSRYAKQFYSPNYSSRISPYNRVPYREQGYYPQGPVGNETYRTRVSRRQQGRTPKSRGRYNAMQQSREKQFEARSSGINLLQRVMSKR